MKQVNQFNFLRWHTSEVFIPTNYDPAQGYMRDGKRCDYMPLLINGEPLNFYINTTDGLNAIIPGLSNIAVSSQANITAAEWAFTLSGVPNAGDIVTIDFTVDTVHYNINSTVIAGWDLTDLINDLYAKILALNPATLPYVSGLNHGVLIQGTSTASGTATATKYDATANAKLKLVDAITGQVVNADIATLLQDSFVDADGNNVFTYYASVSPSLVAPAVYFFRIGDASNNFLESNLVFVPADANYSNYSCLCKFRSDRYYYGVNYQNLDDFYQQFRLHLNEIDEQYENDRDVYNEVSTGKQRVYNNYKKKLRTLETYYFDKSAHDAAEIMFDSEEIYINGRQYTPKATYKVSTNALSKLNKGSIDLYDYDFAIANRCLTPINNTGSGCIAVALPEYSLPDGEAGSAYNYSITLTGDQPFQLSDITKPTWMNIGISGNIISFTGTPLVSATGIAVSFTVSNCSDNNSADVSDTIDIAAAPPANARYLSTVFVSGDALTDYETVQIKGEPGATVTVTVGNYANTNTGTLIFDSTLITTIGQTFTFLLDGSGLSAVISAHINGVSGHMGSIILGRFDITAVTVGSIGSPSTFTISKAFS